MNGGPKRDRESCRSRARQKRAPRKGLGGLRRPARQDVGDRLGPAIGQRDWMPGSPRIRTFAPACEFQSRRVTLALKDMYVAIAMATGVFLQEFAVKYTVVVEESDEGFAVSVPGLPGCHSQGETEAEALDNITHAIREYLDGVKELATSAGTKQVAVEV